MHIPRSRLRVAAITGAVLASCAVTGVSQAVPATRVPDASGSARAPAQPHCVLESHYAPWYRTIAPFENADIQRTTLLPCARFTGSMTGSNYIAKLQAGTGRLAWRTTLSKAHKNNELHLCGAVDVLGNGDLLAISDHTLYKLDGGTGKILAEQNMPTVTSKPNNSAFNGVDGFPGGTIIARSMNRHPDARRTATPPRPARHRLGAREPRSPRPVQCWWRSTRSA